jgi:hypothetical protein
MFTVTSGFGGSAAPSQRADFDCQRTLSGLAKQILHCQKIRQAAASSSFEGGGDKTLSSP